MATDQPTQIPSHLPNVDMADSATQLGFRPLFSSSSMAVPNEAVRGRWSELPTASRYIRRTGWEHRAVPAELSRVPDGIAIPEKLQQIIVWSLMPGEDWSWPSATPSSRALKASSQSNLPSESGSSSTSTADNGENKTPTSSAEDLSTVSYNTSRTRLSQGIRGRSPGGGVSMRTKLLAAMGLNKNDENTSANASGSSPPTAECTSCFDEFPEAAMTKLEHCQHWYCKVCLSTLIVMAMVTEATFPPKCCLSPIPLQQVLKALDSKQRGEYQEKAAEYAVPTTDRWYCPNKDCLKWIPASKLKLNRMLTYDCPHCSTNLCTICRGPAHPAKTECPQDFGLEATLEIAEIEGWQRCYKCRALVEHNSGCRHMTCRCKAQFCYVCGGRWQTCACTETDAANKRAGAARRRQDKSAQVDVEAQEIAQAIAEIEEMERREATQRLLEEERRQREEEEQLELLEVERLEEERQKTLHAEQAEREFRMTLVKSFEAEWSNMEQLYCKLVASQMEELEARHTSEDAKLLQLPVKDTEAANEMWDIASRILARNADRRHARLIVQHKKDAEALTVRQEEEEDDMFLQVQMRLRGKNNRESRMERMLAEIKKQHEDETDELVQKHEAESESLEEKINLDTKGLDRWREYKLAEIKEKQILALQRFGHAVGADRQYFELVLARRRNMLDKHSSLSLTSIANGEDPVGLTEQIASQIEPRLPVFDDGEAGPSGIVRSANEQQGLPVIQAHTEDLQTADTYNDHPIVERPPIPGSFPVDHVPGERRLSVLPIQPKSLRPPSPHHPPPPPPPPPFVVEPLRPRKPVASSALANVNSYPPRCFDLTTSRLQQHEHVAQLQRDQQNEHHHQHEVAGITSTLALASLAAGAALGTVAHQMTKSPRQRDTKAPIVTILGSETHAGSDEKVNRESRAWLGGKKSRWTLRKSSVITEEEMRRKMKQTVGDAWG